MGLQQPWRSPMTTDRQYLEGFRAECARRGIRLTKSAGHIERVKRIIEGSLGKEPKDPQQKRLGNEASPATVATNRPMSGNADDMTRGA